ncbi:Polyisoprenoid-binding protein YceI [Lishizhenia tianjinensis]|jgi:polyisoprenoid-binding protein YceI|uniref:Polyisoprenoid-binding protein YceI n=2 Tax=Lishizhenia tianjinensis TaxID=477690 RepID=A0A1I6XF49_9FLAO|nr:Polyisoprenoid-binding protein YceI [Lishizhenia tianjinensis]
METMTKTVWAVDPTHTDVIFKVKHMMISTVTGHFSSFSGSVHANEEDFSDMELKAEIDIDSIHTKNADRDAHLKSEDFFNAEQYPKMTFVSKSYDGENLVGDLTIRDVTKEVTLNIEHNGTAVDPYGQTKAGFEITGEINRKEFGLSWNAVTEAGNVVVSDKIKLNIEAQFVKQA